MPKKVAIVGGGFGGLAAACLLAKAEYEVTVYEKNEQLGGRAGLLEAGGFRFDTGPSWYLMPGVFERFFALLGERPEHHYTLRKLSPAYRVFDGASGQRLDITGDAAQDRASFAALEPGADKQLQRYLARAAKAHAAAEKFLYADPGNMRALLTSKLAAPQLLLSMHQEAAQFFKTPLLQKIIAYPAVFLGTSPYKAPALYSLLNHNLLVEGVFYPEGGMYKLVETLVKVGRRHGVQHKTNTPVSKIVVKDRAVAGVMVSGKLQRADIVISNAGAYHTEAALLEPGFREHSPAYWQRRSWSPSALLLYLGADRRYDSLAHHNLLFAKEWRKNFTEIFGHTAFPADPSLYVCAPSKTDPGIAPKGCENLMVLVPVSAGLSYTNAKLEEFTHKILVMLEQKMGLEGLQKHIVYQKTFCVHDFAERFNSYRGNGLGLSHTLRQSAIFRPSNASSKVQGLYYVGADVHPGIGLPPALISAELLWRRLTK